MVDSQSSMSSDQSPTFPSQRKPAKKEPEPSQSSSSHSSPAHPPDFWNIIQESQDSEKFIRSPTFDSESPESPSKQLPKEDKEETYQKVKDSVLSEGNASKKFVREKFPEISSDVITGMESERENTQRKSTGREMGV